MFSDAAGTVRIANGATVQSGTKIWVRSTTFPHRGARGHRGGCRPQRQRLRLRRQHAGVSDAQHLILAKTGTLRTTVEATAEFLPPG